MGLTPGQQLETAAAGTDGAEAAERQRPVLLRPGVVSFVIMIVIVGAWEIAGLNGMLNPFFFSRPSEIGVEAWRILVEGELVVNVLVTGYTYLVGVGAACILGIVLGLAMGWWRYFGDIIDPYVVFFSAMPRIALFPILLMIFGISDMSRILIVFLGVLFPVLFNAYIGAKQTPSLLIDVARVFGYSHNRLFVAVVLPAALPYLIAGFRIGVTLGMIMVVVAEFFGASAGLGQKIAVAGELFRAAELYAWVIYTSLVALVLVRGADYFERWAMRWA